VTGTTTLVEAEAVAVEEVDMEAILVMWKLPLLKTLGSSPPWVASDTCTAFHHRIDSRVEFLVI
jgi:hypothetical protein